MAARITSLRGVIGVSTRARITSISAVVATRPRARITKVQGTVGTVAAARITSVAAVYGQAPGAPVVSASPDQTVAAGAVVRLTASVQVTSPATPGTWAWVLLTKSTNAITPTLSNPAAREPTFYPQLRRRASTYTFQVTHTDSQGRVSTGATTTVTVTPAELLFASEGGWNIPGSIAWANPDGAWR